MGTIGYGASYLKNPSKAGEEAARQALDQLSGKRCHSCIVFTTVGYPPETILEAIKGETGPVPMVGCSAAGIIAPGVADESNHAVLVLALADPRIRLTTTGHPCVADSQVAAAAVAGKLNEALSEDARFVLVFPDGLNVVADEFIEAMESHLGAALPLLGGSAGENWRWRGTYQFHDWQAYTGGVAAALVSGDFTATTVVSHGCLPIGSELEITKIEGNRLYEFDHRPAMDVMAEYVGADVWSDFGKVAIHFCLALPLDPNTAQGYDPFIVRFIPKSHPEDKSVSLPVRMRKGDRVWMTRRDHEKMARSAQQSVARLNEELRGRVPFLVLHFDCAGRGRVVLSEADKLELIRSLQKGVAADTPWVGFYTYGEFCPIGSKNHFHNYTAVIVALA
ncbi:MAG: FIST C-terminal domain-containing protein [Desulfomonile tiedjei]|nr:FIST C-terminal domain-containing protein [Desulfomonile tiedjei]